MTLINAGNISCAFLLVLKTIIICVKTQARNRFENIKVVCNCVVARSCVFFGAAALRLRFFVFKEEYHMNVLILDIKDDYFIQPLKNNKWLRLTVGSIESPPLYPIPDFIALDFDWILGDNEREKTLIEIAKKLHPQVEIAAYSKEWNDGRKKMARLFGVDDCVDSDRLAELVDKIYQQNN